MIPYFYARCVANILEHDFRLLKTDGESKLIASSCKAIYESLHGFFGVSGKGSIVRKEQFSNEDLDDLCFCS